MSDQRRTPRKRRWMMLIMSVAVLAPCLYGFGSKFIEFIVLYRSDSEGAFAISPILNYLLASSGFLCLFIWAAIGGMFRDVEQPKHTLLDNEARLDRGAPWRGEIGLDYPLVRQSRRPAAEPQWHPGEMN